LSIHGAQVAVAQQGITARKVVAQLLGVLRRAGALLQSTLSGIIGGTRHNAVCLPPGLPRLCYLALAMHVISAVGVCSYESRFEAG
jgi:hypothetical protein